MSPTPEMREAKKVRDGVYDLLFGHLVVNEYHPGAPNALRQLILKNLHWFVGKNDEHLPIGQQYSALLSLLGKLQLQAAESRTRI